MQSHPSKSLALAGFAVASLIATAGAQTFSDTFDTYPLGPLEGNLTASGATWHGWGGANTNIHQVTSAMASTAPNSVELLIGGDTVIDFDEMTGGNPMTTGKFRMTCDMYVTSDFDGQTYFIGMNEYTDAGTTTYEWAIQVGLDAGVTTAGVSEMRCDCGTAGLVTAPLIVDEWVELRWDLDFTNDNCDFYYGGTYIASYPWSGGVFGTGSYATLSLDALDLYPATAPTTGEVYLDNLEIVDLTNMPFEENFDSYVVGPLEGNLNASGATWHGWGGANTNIHQVTTAMASSVPNSTELIIGGDTVIDFDDMTAGNPMVGGNGKYRLNCEMYVTGNFDGQTYFIAMNEYTDAGTPAYEWAIQVALDAGVTTAGVSEMRCDCGTAGLVTAPLIVDEWVELRWDMDFDADNVDFYYGGTYIASYPWSLGPFGSGAYATISLDALDLYPAVAPTAGGVYIDNIEIIDLNYNPLPGIPYCPGDGIAPNTPCPYNNDNDGSMGGCYYGNTMYPGGGKLTAAGSASLGAGDTYLIAYDVTNDFGVFFGADDRENGGYGTPLTDGLKCAGGNVVRFPQPLGKPSANVVESDFLNIADSGAMPGSARRYQYWFRTPGGPGGTSANLTNAFEIFWLP